MLDKSSVLNFLENNLSEKRYFHSLGVSETARTIAEHYDCDSYKAELSGLLHDCAKEHSLEKQIQYAQNCGFPVDEMTYNIPELLHAPASVYLSREVFGINDMDILSSIRYHATGRQNMSLLEKVILIADIIEPNRKFQTVEKIRQKVYDNIDAALLCAFDSSINYIIKRGFLLHPDTIYARNHIIEFDTWK